MGAIGGNPNTLVASDVTEVIVIDHDNAFDKGFPADDLLRLHIGRSRKDYWREIENQQAWIKKASMVYTNLEKIWDEIPEEWLYSDLDKDDPCSYNINIIRR